MKPSGVGEVRVRAKLTNAVDEGLMRRGLLRPEGVRTCDVEALVDTGAVRTVLPADVVATLGLETRGHEVSRYADGRRETVGITEPLLVQLEGRETVEEALMLGDEVLIGQTVLEKLDLFIDSRGRRLIPNPAHPDYPITRV